MILRALLVVLLAAIAAARGQGTAEATPAAYDVVVFGATPSGVTAAIAASRGGSRVVLLEPGELVGGITAGGLQRTELGQPGTLGGLAREFFDGVLAHYRQAYGPDSPQVKASRGGYTFEPKVAQQVFRRLLAEASVTVYTGEELEAVEAVPPRLHAITTRQAGTGERTRFTAAVFIDATYEGDLLARAGAPFRLGPDIPAAQPARPTGAEDAALAPPEGDEARAPTFNLRGTLCRDPANRLPIPRPRTYAREPYLALVRLVNTHRLTRFGQLFPDLPRWAEINGKLDPNKADLPGVQQAWIEGDAAERARLTARLQDHWLGLWYTLQNDPDLPDGFKEDARRYGLPRDEYPASNHVSPVVHVREGRRLTGLHVLTAHDVQRERFQPDAICLGSHQPEAGPLPHLQSPAGLPPADEVLGIADPYEIPYRCLTTAVLDNLLVVTAVSATRAVEASLRAEPTLMMLGHAGGAAADLARRGGTRVQEVPVGTLRARLTADGIPLRAPYRPWVEIRVLTPPPHRPGQPIEFELVERDVRGPLADVAWNFDGSGEVQGTGRRASHTFPTGGRRTVLVLARESDRVVALPATLDLDLGDAGTLDREVRYPAAALTGRWIRARGPEIEYRGRVGLVDEGRRDGRSRAVFQTTPARTGRYQVAVAYASGPDRATNTPLTVTHAAGSATVTLNQRRKGGPFAFTPVGEFRLEAGQPVSVTYSNEGVDGVVMIDTVRWIWLGP